MGTQFSSSLSSSDTSRLISGLRAAKSKRGSSEGGSGGAGSTSIEKATIAGILSVASGRDFYNKFEESKCFEEVLAWLRKIHGDAKLNGFKNTMKDLADPRNPVPSLGRMLKKITDKFDDDPFRVSISKTTKSIIAQAASVNLSSRKAETEAQRLGRKFSTLNGEDIVEQFVRGFVEKFVESILDRADPNHSMKAVRDAMEISKTGVRRISSSTIQKTKAAGKLNDYSAIKRTLIDELKQAMSVDIA